MGATLYFFCVANVACTFEKTCPTLAMRRATSVASLTATAHDPGRHRRCGGRGATTRQPAKFGKASACIGMAFSVRKPPLSHVQLTTGGRSAFKIRLQEAVLRAMSQLP